MSDEKKEGEETFNPAAPLTEEEKAEADKAPDDVMMSEMGLTIYFLGVPRGLDIKVWHQEKPSDLVAAIKQVQSLLASTDNEKKDLGMMAKEATLRGVWRWFASRFAKTMPTAKRVSVAWRPEAVSATLEEFRDTDKVKALN